MAGKVEMLCEEHIVPKIQELGYDVVEVEYAKKVDGMNLTFTIDSENGINLDDCEKVHKMVDALLDELNPTGDSTYILNVSSVGLDRPVKNQKDFLRNKGKLVEVKMFKPFENKKSFIGTLEEFSDEKVSIKIDEKIISFDKNMIAQIVPVIEF